MRENVVESRVGKKLAEITRDRAADLPEAISEARQNSSEDARSPIQDARVPVLRHKRRLVALSFADHYVIDRLLATTCDPASHVLR